MVITTCCPGVFYGACKQYRNLSAGVQFGNNTRFINIEFGFQYMLRCLNIEWPNVAMAFQVYN